MSLENTHSPGMKQRLQHPEDPLIIHARPMLPTFGTPEKHSPRHDTGRHSPQPDGLTSLLDREHRVNRLQAAELRQMREELQRLRAHAHAANRDSPQPSTPPHTPRRRNERRDVIQLAAGVRQLEDQIAQLEQALKTKDRQVAELEEQLLEATRQSKGLAEELEHKNAEHETYLHLVDGAPSLDAVCKAFQDMSLAQLNNVNVALTKTLNERRTDTVTTESLLEASFSDAMSSRHASKRSITPFPMRPRSVAKLLTKKDKYMSGNSDSFAASGLPSPGLSSVMDFGSDGYESDATARPEGGKAVRFADQAKKVKKGRAKTKFSVAGLFNKK